jgi:hypothetical protein
MLRIVAAAALWMSFSATFVYAGEFDGPSSGNQPSTFKNGGLNPNPAPQPQPQPAPRQPTLTQSDVVHNSSGTAPSGPPNGNLQGPNKPNLLPGAAFVRPGGVPVR